MHLACWMLFCAPLGVARAQGTLREPVEAFFGPAAAAFSADGKTLFVANCARTDFGMIAGRGALSRVAVGRDGELTVENARFVDGLNAPVGLAVLPVSVGDLPAGTVAVAVGGRWVMKDRSTRVDDPRERGTGLMFFDPATGKNLASAYMGRESQLEAVLGHPVLEPGHIAVDTAGNLFLADVAGQGLKSAASPRERSGIVRLTVAGLSALVRGEPPAKSDVAFLDVPEVAGGIAWSGKDRRFYWATGAGYGDMIGAVLSIDGGSFGPGGSIRTVETELQPMVGACVTAAGSLLVEHTDGTIGVIKRGRGKVKPLRFRDRPVFLSPGQPAATTLGNGQTLVVVPEIAGGGRPAWHHRLQVFTLPSDY